CSSPLTRSAGNLLSIFCLMTALLVDVNVSGLAVIRARSIDVAHVTGVAAPGEAACRPKV
ncbi:MAG: hypothetical protein RMN25_11560, partial [Anaerolineae bacterium]|nr:hypothetical protein [Thermoflexales bacterium]MDW8408406.1 hypothetical protein [Anaerolineae bacterium]